MKQYILVALIAIVIGTSAGFFLPAKQVYAQDGSGWAIFGEMLLEWGETVLKWVEDEIWPVLRDQAVKRIVDDLTDQIIDSIENGGSPLFVKDPLGALQREGDITFDTFNAYLGSETGINLCAPFQAQLSLYFQTTFQKEPKFGIPARCTFEEFEQALQDSAHLIERGGWISFQQAFAPSNNFFGASLLVDQAYMSEVSRKVDQTSNSLNRNLGFTDVRVCNRWSDPFTGALISPADADRFGRIIAFKDESHNPQNEAENSKLQNAKDSMCERWETVTPGSVVAQAATKGVLKDFEYAANVQSILSALVNSALSKVFDVGKGGLLGAHSSYRGSNIGSGYGDDQENILTEMKSIQETYASLISHFQSLTNLAITAEQLARQRILTCYAGWEAGGHNVWPENIRNDYFSHNWGGRKMFGPPGWGQLVYGNAEQAELRKYATLGDLIDYPHKVTASNGVQVELPLSSDPNYLASKDGYFTKILGHKNSSGDFLEDGPLFLGKKDAQNNIENVRKVITLLEGGGGDVGSVNYATTTKILTQVKRDFSSYGQKYSEYANEVISRQYISGGEPGQMAILSKNTFGTMLGSIVVGLQEAAIGFTRSPYHDPINFYYCVY